MTNEAMMKMAYKKYMAKSISLGEYMSVFHYLWGVK